MSNPGWMLIQNADVNAHKKDYEHLAEDEMLITSSFFTIQGEGPLAGQRAYFVRTAGCNFGEKKKVCQWCDTNFKLSEGKVETVYSIVRKAHSALFEDDGSALVVITGGEPLLQPNTMRLCETLVDSGFVVQIETNGTYLHRANVLAALTENFHIVCSPKQIDGHYAPKPRFEYDTAKNPVSFKFVVSSDPNSTHYDLPSWVYEIHDAYVYVSPMTVYKKAYTGEVSSVWDADLVDQEKTADNYKYAAHLVMMNPNFRLSCQVHTFLGVA